MSQNIPEFTEEQIRAAEAAEQAALDESQKVHMRKRVVLLRVQLEHTREQLAEAQDMIRILREGDESDTTPKEPEEPSVR